MNRFLKIHWITFCVMVFIVSRLIMIYQYDLAYTILSHLHGTNFFSNMCKWDCQWYLTIIKDGYDLHPRSTPRLWHGLANWAFFPLYPYTVKFISMITGAKAIVTGIILNQLIILLALMVFYRYLKLSVDEGNSRFGVIILAFSPFSIYFISLYTEALFLLLSLLSFYYMKTHRPFIAALFGGLLSATRPIGFMFSVALLFFQIKNSKGKFGRIVAAIILSCIAVSGLLLYMLYLHIHVGDFLAFKHIQKAWGRHGIDTANLSAQIWIMIKDTHNFILFAISIIISVYLLVLKYYEEAIFNLLCILPGALTGTMMSEGRFSGTLFTFYFGWVIMARKSTSFKLVVAFLFILFYISYFLYWMARSSFLI